MADSTPPRRTVTAGIPNGNKSTQMPPPQDMTPRKTAVLELLAIPQMPLLGLAAVEAARNPEGVSVYAMDLWTIQTYSDPFADAIVGIANQYPVLGTFLDRMAVTGPILQLFGIILQAGVQIAENHGSLPAGMQGVSPSLIRREELARQIKAEADARAAANA